MNLPNTSPTEYKGRHRIPEFGTLTGWLPFMTGQHEVGMATCGYGCKVFENGKGDRWIHHHGVYGCTIKEDRYQ